MQNPKDKRSLRYAQKRASQRLGAPRFHVVRPGWAEAEQRRFIELGRRDVQFKWKVLCPQASEHDRQAIVRTVQPEVLYRADKIIK